METILPREEMVRLILDKSKNPDTLLILAFSETDLIEKIYCELYNVK